MNTQEFNVKRMKLHYIDQLHKLDYLDTDDLDIHELRSKLTLARMKNIDYDNANNEWFK